ncbi:MAG: ABC transporter substrate-binding protein, partial [Candidatus Limnocylindrales bacterium]
MIRSKRVTLLAGVVGAMTAVSAVGSAFAQDASGSPAAAAVGVPATPTGYTELDQALGADKPFAGKRVTMQTQWIGGEGDNFNEAIAGFEAATGIDITVAEVPSGQHETLVNVSLNGGAAADIIQLAQPAAINTYGKDGLIKDISTILDTTKLSAELPTGAYTTDGTVWAIPYRGGLKSVVWYPIKAFAEKGYEVPTTWDELVALSDKIVADGGAPWCVGIDAGPATGWIITDWVEDVMIRTVGEEKYNQWISHELPFNSPEVKNAFDLVGKMLFTPGYVYGGSTAILATPQTAAMDPMWGASGDLTAPECWMQKQSDWYSPDFNPDKKASSDPNFQSAYVVGEDLGLFYFPVIDPEIGNPVLYAGDAFMVTNDTPEVKAVAQFLATPASIETWVKKGVIALNNTVPPEWTAGNYKLETAADLIGNATFLAFDGGDVMPPSVGAGSFWTGTVDWISADGTNTDAVLEAIDAS